MPKSPNDRQPEALAREVDLLLAQLPTFGSQSGPRPAVRAKSPAAAPPNPGPTRRDRVALWARVFLGVALGGLMTQWPYPNGCGLPLLGYLGGILTVLLAAGWIAFASWNLRSGVTHIAALILFYWGLVLAAEQLLPRIGYAVDRAGWRCPAVLPVHDRGSLASG